MSDVKKDAREYGKVRKQAFLGRHVEKAAKREKKLMINGMAKSG